jgi:hypothetical protein
MEKKKKEDEQKRLEAEERKKKGGNKLMSGRDLFEFNPILFKDDDENAFGELASGVIIFLLCCVVLCCVVAFRADSWCECSDARDLLRVNQDLEGENMEIDEGLFAEDELADLDIDDEQFDDDDDEADSGAGESHAAIGTTSDSHQQGGDDDEGESSAYVAGGAFPQLTDQQLKDLPKKDLIELLKEFGDGDFSIRHQLGGQVKNVMKKKKAEELHAAYKELQMFRK